MLELDPTTSRAGEERPERDRAFEIRRIDGGLGLSFATSALGVRDALLRVRAELQGAGIGEADLQTLELVLAEVMNNVVEHAYGADSGAIELEVSRRPDGLRCVICDRGGPMPDARPPKGELAVPGRTFSSYQEGGFGWYLIRQLSTDLVYVRAGGANRLTFHIPFDTPSAADARPAP